MQLNGFELHIYNRTSTYKELEKKFGIFTGLFNHNDIDDDGNKDVASKDSGSGTESSSNYLLGKNWRDLIPVVKVCTSYICQASLESHISILCLIYV